MRIEYAIILILFSHFIADFICQSQKMAINKSSSNVWLTIHVLVYTLTMLPVAMFLDYLLGGELSSWFIGNKMQTGICKWWLFNGFVHWGVDFMTSKLTKYLWTNKKERLFFMTIGLDQFIHTATLIWSYVFFIQ